MRRGARLASLATLFALVAALGAVANGAVDPAPLVSATTASVTGTTSATVSGSVNPQGLPTGAYFEYGLDQSLRATSGTLYDQRTAAVSVGSDSASHPVGAQLSGLVPNATYHARLVAGNSAGTTFGPDVMFKTRKDSKPPPPTLGKTAWVRPVTGLVLIKPPPGKQFPAAVDGSAQAALSKGSGFVPLTEQRQIPLGTQVDARRGSLLLSTATTTPGKSQLGTFGGSVFKITQDSTGLNKGLTTLILIEGAFPGAPSFSTCAGRQADPRTAHAAVSAAVLQTLHARDRHGHFRTRGRFSAGTVRGTVWDTVDRCDGTLTAVRRGAVVVTDFGLRKTVLVTAGHSYLAKRRATTSPY
jgi:hypothetical protein